MHASNDGESFLRTGIGEFHAESAAAKPPVARQLLNVLGTTQLGCVLCPPLNVVFVAFCNRHQVIDVHDAVVAAVCAHETVVPPEAVARNAPVIARFVRLGRGCAHDFTYERGLQRFPELGVNAFGRGCRQNRLDVHALLLLRRRHNRPGARLVARPAARGEQQ